MTTTVTALCTTPHLAVLQHQVLVRDELSCAARSNRRASLAVDGVAGGLHGHALHEELKDARQVPLGVDIGH